MGITGAGQWGQESKEESSVRSALYKNISFLTLEEGDNVVRFIGKYVYRNMHYYPHGKLHHIICIGPEACPLCKMGVQFSFYYYSNVLDRKDDKMKILRFGPTIKDFINTISKSFGDPKDYDILITRRGKGLNTKYPAVLPMKDGKPLTTETIEHINAEYQDLETIFKLPTLDEVLDFMKPNEKTHSAPAQQYGQPQPILPYPPPQQPSAYPLPNQYTPVPPTHIPPNPSIQPPQVQPTAAPIFPPPPAPQQAPQQPPIGFHVPPKPTVGAEVQQSASPVKSIEEGKKEKTCFADPNFYNPMRVECMPCHLKADCKSHVLDFYSKP